MPVAVRPLLVGFREGTVAVVTEDRILAVKVNQFNWWYGGGGWKTSARLGGVRVESSCLINCLDRPWICRCENAA
jgi:hypothetical protein